MSTKANTKKISSANLEAWDQAAPIHQRHNHERLLKAFSNDPNYSVLDDIETNILKTLAIEGKDVAQVCCNNGQELISVKKLGAGRCVGFDGAQGFIDQARELAKAANLDVEFVCSDIYDLAEDHKAKFDVVTITIGVISWMPDLAGFFRIVSGLLKPGGALFIYEQHPILNMIEPAEADAPIVWELSYFDKEPYVETDGLDYFGGEDYDAKPATSFSHTMSEVIMAGLDCGLSLEHFEELPGHISNTWWNVEHQELGLPMSFTLVMRRP